MFVIPHNDKWGLAHLDGSSFCHPPQLCGDDCSSFKTMTQHAATGCNAHEGILVPVSSGIDADITGCGSGQCVGHY